MREFMILNGISAAIALISLGLAVWTVLSDRFKGGIDDLFLVLTCLFLALVFSIQPVAWVVRRWAVKRAARQPKAMKEVIPPASEVAKEKIAAK